MKSKLIAVTGGIGSGKSEVIGYLQSLGYATIDCDALAKEVACRKQVVEQVRDLLGVEYVIDGKLNRRAIRNRVFFDDELLKKYNAIFFSEVKKLLDERIAELIGKNVIFVEISVFDAFEYPWDGVWLVEADDEIRIDRALSRDKTSRETLQGIMSRQNKCTSFTLRIPNNGTVLDLKKHIDAAVNSIK